MSMLAPGVQSQIDSAGHLPDAYLVAIIATPITVGKEWVQLSGFEFAVQNYDVQGGGHPALTINDATDGVEVAMKGRYHVHLDSQLSDPTADGYFECAVEMNGMSLVDWPTEMQQGHDTRWINAAASAWDGVQLGQAVGYSTPQINPGATITAWARFGTSSGTATVGVKALLYASMIAR